MRAIWWLLGLALGFVGTWVAILAPTIGLPIYAVSTLALLVRTRSWEMGGAVLLATGLWFTYVHFSMIAACAARNSSSGSCTVIDESGTAVPAAAFVFAGAVLSVYALGKRSVRGGE